MPTSAGASLALLMLTCLETTTAQLFGQPSPWLNPWNPWRVDHMPAMPGPHEPAMVKRGSTGTPTILAHLDTNTKPVEGATNQTGSQSSQAPPVCVGFHAFNSKSILSELMGYIDNVPQPSELIVHLDKRSVDFKHESTAIETRFPNATVIITDDNRGADIGGKLLIIEDIMSRPAASRCRTVLFVHSKTRDWWRKAMLDPLIGTPKIAAVNLQNMLSRPEIGQIGSVDAMVRQLARRDFDNGFESGNIVAEEVSAKGEEWIENHMSCNLPLVQEYCERLKVKVPATWQEIDFVAGSCFWIRTDILEEVFQNQGAKNDPLEMYGELDHDYSHRDCERPHALERFFGWITTAKGRMIKWVSMKEMQQLTPINVAIQPKLDMPLSADDRTETAGISGNETATGADSQNVTTDNTGVLMAGTETNTSNATEKQLEAAPSNIYLTAGEQPALAPAAPPDSAVAPLTWSAYKKLPFGSPYRDSRQEPDRVIIRKTDISQPIP